MWKGRKWYINPWHIWFTGPRPILAKVFPPSLCLFNDSIPEIDNTKGLFTNRTNTMWTHCHSVAATQSHSSPGLPLTVWSYLLHSSPALTSTQIHPHVSPLLSSSSATRPGGHQDRQAWLDRGEGGWTKSASEKGLCSLQSSFPVLPQLGLSTYNRHCIMTHT